MTSGPATANRVRRIVACGSRDWTDRAIIRLELEHYLPESLTVDEPTVIHGACGWTPRSYSVERMKGADRLIHEEATDLGFWVEAMPADWKQHGKAAGPIRNRQMLDRHPDLVLAFWDGQSRGTKDTIDEARRRGIRCHIVQKVAA